MRKGSAACFFSGNSELSTFLLYAGDLYMDKAHSISWAWQQPSSAWQLHFLLLQALILCLLHSKLPAGHGMCHLEDILSHMGYGTSILSGSMWAHATRCIFPGIIGLYEFVPRSCSQELDYRLKWCIWKENRRPCLVLQGEVPQSPGLPYFVDMYVPTCGAQVQSHAWLCNLLSSP